ncbi:MAG TPA: SMC-Scp complex subunit ScpB [Terriglobales bacterium]|nr:SMC-Scp complex subunit ScpB [Terriglobales bacterium]
MKYSRTEGVLEALLFAAGTPAELELLARAVELDADTCAAVLDNMRARYAEEDRGIELLRLGDAYQLCTKAEFADTVRAALEKRRDAALSPAAFEVLAIAAYNQPITRAFIEQARGVDSSGVVSALVEKGFLEERGRLDAPGRPMQFGTTPSFLRTFGLSSLDELPPIGGESGLFATASAEPQAVPGGSA